MTNIHRRSLIHTLILSGIYTGSYTEKVVGAGNYSSGDIAADVNNDNHITSKLGSIEGQLFLLHLPRIQSYPSMEKTSTPNTRNRSQQSNILLNTMRSGYAHEPDSESKQHNPPSPLRSVAKHVSNTVACAVRTKNFLHTLRSTCAQHTLQLKNMFCSAIQEREKHTTPNTPGTTLLNSKDPTLYLLALLLTSTQTAAEITTDGSVGAATNVDLIDNTYTIPESLGTTSGNNLFHSFSQFNVETNTTANFTGSANIQNIFSRVTGGHPSNIDGTLRSSIQGANLYLMNPYGIIFGPNATLDVTGSFYATTADSLLFEDGLTYNGRETTPPLAFSVVPVEAFGFSSNEPAAITVQSSQLFASNGSDLSLIGGDINVLNYATLFTNNGTVNLASASGPTTVNQNLQVSAPANGQLDGNIALANGANIIANGDTGGNVVIRGGKLAVLGSNIISTTTGGIQQTNPAAAIDIATDDEISVDQFSTIATTANAGTVNPSADINLNTKKLSISNLSRVATNVEENAFAKGGNINIDAQTMEISNYSQVAATTAGFTGAGDINITADELTIINGGTMGSGSPQPGFDFFNNLGDAGNINIDADTLTISSFPASDDSIRDSTGIFLSTGVNQQNTSSINIKSKDMLMDNRGRILSISKDVRRNGDISVDAENLQLLNGASLATGALESTNSDAGNITINSKDILLSGIYPVFDLPALADHSSIVTSIDNSAGKTGDITITTDNLSVLDGARVINAADGGASKSGNIIVTADAINIEGKNEQLFSAFVNENVRSDIAIRFSSSKVSTEKSTSRQSTAEEAGSIKIETEDLTLNDYGNLQTVTRNSGNSGEINVSAKSILISNGANISSASESAISVQDGDAGNITITADNLSIKGSSDSGVFTGINSSANEFAGESGTVNIFANDITLDNHATINSETQGNQDGGDIQANATGLISLSRDSAITTSALSESSNAGNIDLNAEVIVLNKSTLKTTAKAGNGGNINLTATAIIATPDSVIDSSSNTGIDGEKNIITDIIITNALADLPDSFADDNSIKLSSVCEEVSHAQSQLTLIKQPMAPITWLQGSLYTPPNNLISSRTSSDNPTERHVVSNNSSFTNNTQANRLPIFHTIKCVN